MLEMPDEQQIMKELPDSSEECMNYLPLHLSE